MRKSATKTPDPNHLPILKTFLNCTSNLSLLHVHPLWDSSPSKLSASKAPLPKLTIPSKKTHFTSSTSEKKALNSPIVLLAASVAIRLRSTTTFFIVVFSSREKQPCLKSSISYTSSSVARQTTSRISKYEKLRKLLRFCVRISKHFQKSSNMKAVCKAVCSKPS